MSDVIISTEQNSIAFQINEMLNVQDIGHKPTSDEVRQFNHSQYWKYQERTITILIDNYIAIGETFRFGVKRETNKQDSFEFADGCALDIDAVTEDQLLAAIDNKLSGYSFLIYTSPSYNPEIGKFGARIDFKWSRRIDDLKLAKKAILWLICLYNPNHLAKITGIIEATETTEENKIDTVTFDPCRLWYGMTKDSLVLSRDDEAVLDIDSIIETIPDEIHTYIDKVAQYELNLQTGELTNNQKFAAYLQETIGDPSVIVQKLVEAYQKDHPHLIFANCGVHGSPGTALAEWRMFDVILGSRDGNGKSFALSIMLDGTIVFISGKTGISGDIPTLAYYLKAGSWDVAPMTKDTMSQNRKIWYEMAKEVCDRLEIPEYRFSDDYDSGNELDFVDVGEVIANDYLAARNGNLIRYISRRSGRATAFYEYVNYQLLFTELPLVKVGVKLYIIKRIKEKYVGVATESQLKTQASSVTYEPINEEIGQVTENNERIVELQEKLEELSKELRSLDLTEDQFKRLRKNARMNAVKPVIDSAKDDLEDTIIEIEIE